MPVQASFLARFFTHIRKLALHSTLIHTHNHKHARDVVRSVVVVFAALYSRFSFARLCYCRVDLSTRHDATRHATHSTHATHEDDVGARRWVLRRRATANAPHAHMRGVVFNPRATAQRASVRGAKRGRRKGLL